MPPDFLLALPAGGTGGRLAGLTGGRPGVPGGQPGSPLGTVTPAPRASRPPSKGLVSISSFPPPTPPGSPSCSPWWPSQAATPCAGDTHVGHAVLDLSTPHLRLELRKVQVGLALGPAKKGRAIGSAQGCVPHPPLSKMGSAARHFWEGQMGRPQCDPLFPLCQDALPAR